MVLPRTREPFKALPVLHVATFLARIGGEVGRGTAFWPVESLPQGTDRQAPLQMVCGGKQGRDPPCWFIGKQSHPAGDWSCHWPFQQWNREVLFCTFIELHSVLSGQCTPLYRRVQTAQHVKCAHWKLWCRDGRGGGRFPGKTAHAVR